MPPANKGKRLGGVRMMLVLLLLACALFFISRHSGRLSGPQIELVEAQTDMFSNSEHWLVWEISLPEGFVSASQFALHIDEESHYGDFGKTMEPSSSGYPRTLFAQPEMLEGGSIRVSFRIFERRPTLLYYRLHLLLDGKHYWTPEAAMSIRHRPAFTDEFQESYLDETLEHFAFLA